MSEQRTVMTPEERVVSRFTKYLNGPLGKSVLQNLDEGESFILQTSELTLRVTKVRGHAFVEISGLKPSLSWDFPSS